MEENKEKSTLLGKVIIIGTISAFISVVIFWLICDSLCLGENSIAKLAMFCIAFMVGYPIKWVGKSKSFSYCVIASGCTLIASLAFTALCLEFNFITILFSFCAAILSGLIALGLRDVGD